MVSFNDAVLRLYYANYIFYSSAGMENIRTGLQIGTVTEAGHKRFIDLISFCFSLVNLVFFAFPTTVFYK